MQKQKASTFDLLAKTLTGLEETLAAELTALGATEVSIQNRAVSFNGDQEILYKTNLNLRTALRVLKPILQFEARDENQLYRAVHKMDWTSYLNSKDTFAIDSFVSSRYFKHSKYIALKTKDAIADHFRKKTDWRPSIDVENPTLRLNMHIANHICTLSLDSSGTSLHRRGYRLAKNEAPLNEVLAAGMVLLSGWNGKIPFIDPMCGSGTLPIEAALIAANMAPGLTRSKFGFMNWRDFDKQIWDQVQKQARAKVKALTGKIIGSDKSMNAIRVAQENIERAGLKGKIELQHLPFEKQCPPESLGVLIFNPPYGERMKPDDIGQFYRAIGDRLKQAYAGYDAWILSGNKPALKQIGLRASKRLTLFNGPIECKFHRFSLYQGSIKSKYQKT